ncbi:MAG: hypothetical protein NDI63_04360 [Pseudobdellovibrio sp.]|nr:hypothetical protein [Pseudobdellovibrio sp.]
MKDTEKHSLTERFSAFEEFAPTLIEIKRTKDEDKKSAKIKRKNVLHH